VDRATRSSFSFAASTDFQSAFFVDGIRVYLPADNRLDLGFFNTATLAEIQVEKGYVSVLSGPGAMGGALNLVTRKPRKPSNTKRAPASRWPATAITTATTRRARRRQRRQNVLAGQRRRYQDGSFPPLRQIHPHGHRRMAASAIIRIAQLQS
jgi:outer membrane receptor protein involved in Fe transport